MLLVLSLPFAIAAGAEILPFEPDDTLEEIRYKIDHNGYSFEVADNWVFNMSREEKSRFFSRRAPTFPRALAADTGIGPLGNRLGTVDPPSSFDWRNYSGHAYIGDIRDQGTCGSCYAFAACASAEGTYNWATGNFDNNCANFSESYVIWCLGRYGPYGPDPATGHFGGCDGADYDYMELEALTVEGVGNESDFPYQENDPGSCTHWGDQTTVFQSWHRVPCSDIDAIKTAIMTYGVVDTAVYVGSAFSGYAHGIYEDSNTTCDGSPCYNTTTNHAISLIGWDDSPPEGGDGVWILRNSWGTGWGESGYMRIRYTSAAVACAVCYLVYQPPMSPTPTPVGYTTPTPTPSITPTPEGYRTPTPSPTSSVTPSPAPHAIPFSENFVGTWTDGAPGDWTKEYIMGTNDWAQAEGGYNSHPASAHGGSYNAWFFYDDWADIVTRLISPRLEFGTRIHNTRLSFWLAMEEWQGDQDELSVYYRTSAGGAWNLLTHYDTSLPSWTERTVDLPDPGDDYYICFQGTANYGYGVCIDDLLVTGDAVSPTPTPVAPTPSTPTTTPFAPTPATATPTPDQPVSTPTPTPVAPTPSTPTTTPFALTPATVTPTPDQPVSTPTPQPSATPSPIVNLLLNPSFELEPALVNWSKVGDSEMIYRGIGGAQGTYCCVFQDPTTQYSERGIRSEAVSITAGNYYDFNGWFYLINEGETVDDTQFRFLIEWRDITQAILSTSGTSDWDLTSFDVWEEKSYPGIQAPAGSAYVTLYLAAKETLNNNNDALIDYFCINPGGAPPSPTPQISTTPPLPTPSPTPSTSCSYRVSGRIFDSETTAAVPDADVWLEFSDHETTAVHTSGPDGSYSIFTYQPHAPGIVIARATHPDYLPGNTATRWACYTEIEGVDLELERVSTPTPLPSPTPTPVRRRPWIHDYNGDGTSDIAVFRENSGLWAVRFITRAYFGTVGDIPVPGDYDGDGTTDPGIFRSSIGLWSLRGVSRIYFGGGDDIPLPGDYTGDGTWETAVFQESSGLWAIRSVTRTYFGRFGDTPVPGYYAGESSQGIGIFRGTSGLWALKESSRIYFGHYPDTPVPGDYDGTGNWSVGIYRPGTGLWALRGVTRTYFGTYYDWAIPGDYNGDGIDDIGIFRQSSGLWAVRRVTRVYFGLSSDIPVTR